MEDSEKQVVRKGHPKGFWVVAFVEMCERFATCGIGAIMILYMKAGEGGLGWASAYAFSVLGIFRMMACVTSIPGGYIADRWLGARRCVCIGALICLAGDFILAVPSEIGFFTGLVCLAVGGGFYKPNITTVLGRLYDPNDPHKESAFTIFYLSVNVGSLISTLAIGFLAKQFGWRCGFLLAGSVLLIGQIVYFFGQRFLMVTDQAVAKSSAKTVEKVPLTASEKRRVGVVLFSFVVVIVFMIAYEQLSGLLTDYIENSTNRLIGSFTVPTTWFNSLNPFIVIVFAPMLAGLWTFLSRRRRDPSAMVKMGLGAVVLGLGFVFMAIAACERNASPSHLSSMSWVVITYFFCTIGELLLCPVALSFITSTAPARMTSQIMGWYIAVQGLSCYLAAWIGSLADKLGEFKVFACLLIMTTLIGALQLAFARKITRFANE